MNDELALQYERPRGGGPKITQEDINDLLEALFRTHRWMTAEDLGFHAENDKRVLRAIAAASGGHVISGQAGYRLHFEATADESRVAMAGWRKMRSTLEHRIIQSEQIYHRKEVPECLRVRVEAARPAA
jgi:hypothetical protein